MTRCKNSLGLVFFPAFDWSISPSHPERAERLLYTRDQVVEEGLLDLEGIKEYNPVVVDNEDIQRTHICVPDVTERITKSHRISAGGAVKAGQVVLNGEVDKAFAIVRPPGHHARRVVHGSRGFCTVNIEAIMIEYLRKNYSIDRIAIIDTDCHHGDGTQDIYRNDPEVLFVSLHQDGRTLYPGSGFINEIGGSPARGYTLNIPFPPGTADDGLLYTIEELVLPILDEFKPDLIINSAGQDNHFSDPLTNMNISARGYAKMNEILDPDIAVLEGGYAIEDALPYVNTGIIMAMAGLDYEHIKEPDFDKSILGNTDMNTIHKICEKVREKWKQRSIDFTQNQTEKREIYYDTDGIRENQRENIFCCPQCNGFIELESKASNGYLIKVLLLPWATCDRCRHKAYNIYDEIHPNDFDIIYLQDKDRNEFYRKKL